MPNRLIVRVLLALSLPVWVLLLAVGVGDNGSPTLTAAATPILAGVTVAGGLFAGGLALWAVFDQKRVKRQMPALANASQPRETLIQTLLGAIGSAAFLAAGYQAVGDFDVYRRLAVSQGWPGSETLSSWDTLLVLSAVQVVCFLAQALATQR